METSTMRLRSVEVWRGGTRISRQRTARRAMYAAGGRAGSRPSSFLLSTREHRRARRKDATSVLLAADRRKRWSSRLLVGMQPQDFYQPCAFDQERRPSFSFATPLNGVLLDVFTPMMRPVDASRFALCPLDVLNCVRPVTDPTRLPFPVFFAMRVFLE